IVSAEPSFTMGFNGEASVGNFGAYGGSASVTGPIVEDKVAGRLYAAARKRDGLLDIVTGPGPRTQTEDVNQEYWTVRGQMLFTPSDAVRLRLIADYTSRDDDC